MLRIMSTKGGYGCLLVEELRFLVEDLTHRDAVLYARRYQEVEREIKIGKKKTYESAYR